MTESAAYPAGCARTHLIAELAPGDEAVLAGRIAAGIGTDGPRLKDESGEVSLAFGQTPERPRNGDVVELRGTWQPPDFQVRTHRVLAPALRAPEAGRAPGILRTRARILAFIRRFF